MGTRRTNRWLPEEAFSLSEEARGAPVEDFTPPRPVHAWIQTKDHLGRVEARAMSATPDAVLVTWGFGQAEQSAWVWRAAVRHRRIEG